jgi:hypothetical protein
MLGAAPAELAGAVSAVKNALTRFGTSLGAAIVVPITSAAAGSQAHAFVTATQAPPPPGDPTLVAYNSYVATGAPVADASIRTQLITDADQYLRGIHVALAIVTAVVVATSVAVWVFGRSMHRRATPP